MARPTIISVAVVAGLAAGWMQMSLAATQTNLDTNTLSTGIAPAAGDPPGIAPTSADPAPMTLRPGATPGAVDATPADPRAPASAREVRGNPLWAIPLKVLTATRERPLFLPSRRAPAAAVAGPPAALPVAVAAPPPAPPERPHLSLVGAIVGDSEGFAVFLDEATREVVRMKTGESRGGWVLTSVRGREATLQRDRESIVLSLPTPNDQPLPQQRPMTPNSDNL